MFSIFCKGKKDFWNNKKKVQIQSENVIDKQFVESTVNKAAFHWGLKQNDRPSNESSSFFTGGLKQFDVFNVL